MKYYCVSELCYRCIFLILGPVVVQDTLCLLSFGMCGVLGLIAYCLFVWNLGTCRLMELCYVFFCDVLWFEIGCVLSDLVGAVFWSFAPPSPLGGRVRHTTVCGTLCAAHYYCVVARSTLPPITEAKSCQLQHVA